MLLRLFKNIIVPISDSFKKEKLKVISGLFCSNFPNILLHSYPAHSKKCTTGAMHLSRFLKDLSNIAFIQKKLLKILVQYFDVCY